MKNVKYYTDNAFEFFKQVCSNKRKVDLKERVKKLNVDIEALYKVYDEKFLKNDLISLRAKGYDGKNHTDLQELYSYGSKAFVDLRTELTTTGTKRMVKCQHCTLNDVDTFDHFVPQEEFSEFAVHPRNLLCCCTQCNRKRNEVWRANGRPTTLNLYLDKLPNVRYLFVNLKVSKDTVSTDFFIDNRNKIETNLYQLIQNHYLRLSLFERFSENVDSVVTSFVTDMQLYNRLSNGPLSLTLVREHIETEQIALGHNYWQSILKLALIDNSVFLKEYCGLDRQDILP